MYTLFRNVIQAVDYRLEASDERYIVPYIDSRTTKAILSVL